MVVIVTHVLPILSAACLAQISWAGSDFAGPVEAVFERVIDGDTVRVSAKIWVDQQVSVSVRLKGVDAPELFRPQCEGERAIARQAKSFVEASIGVGVLLRDIEHDKYGGRVVARLETAGGVDIGAALLAEGLAMKIGSPGIWCR